MDTILSKFTPKVDDQSGGITVIPDLNIPLSDGRHLSARLWLPADAFQTPVPALIEYAPFRHYDASYARDEKTHPWFAENGYASLRVDPAGSMNSDGLPMDEYTQREQTDCVEALAWIANQEWCAGTTGMFGMSWSAISALQVAALRPPSLKAIIPVHGTDDRFEDDIHFKGGCMLTDSLAWGSLYQTHMLRPPHPDLDPDWRTKWLHRLENAPEVLSNWISNNERDVFWPNGSVRSNYSAIEAATYLVAGWADGYTNASFRLMKNLTCPKKLLVGPWGHAYPHLAMPGPKIDFLNEAKRWWDKWLKGLDDKKQHEDTTTVFLQNSQAPEKDISKRDGKWIRFSDLLPKRLRQEQFFLGNGTLCSASEVSKIIRVETSLSNAIHAGEWLPHGIGAEMPGDQNDEDQNATCFDTPVLENEINICGRAKLRLKLKNLSSDGEILVRVNDIRPDGTIALITYGILRLAKTNDQKTDPMNWTQVEIELDEITQSLPKGHQLRLVISTRAWPMIWPSAGPSAIEIDTLGSLLSIPIIESSELPPVEVFFDTPQETKQTGVKWHRKAKRERTVKRAVEDGTISRTFAKDDGAFEITESGTIVDGKSEIRFSAKNEDPLSVQARFRHEIGFQFMEAAISLMTELEISADEEQFFIRGFTRALENETIIHTRDWGRAVARKVKAKNLPQSN